MRVPFSFIKSAGEAAVVDPATLPLTGWYRASFLAAPWTSIASAGPSIGRQLKEPTTPPSRGTSLLGLTGANFDGSNDRLNQDEALDIYLSASAWWVGLLVRADTAAATAAGEFYEDAAIITEANGGWGVAFTTSGVRAGNYDGAFKKTGWVALGTATWAWVEAWLSGGVLSISVDGGTPATVSAGNLTSLAARPMRLGANFDYSKFFDGQLAELMVMDSVPSADQRERIRNSYLCHRYGLNFTGDPEHTCPPVVSGAWQPCTAPNANLYTQTTLTTTAGYQQRDGARLHWFGGKWWLLGGWWPPPSDWEPDHLTNQIQSSADLITWTEELPHDPGDATRWSPRHTFMSWVHAGKLWVAGGDQYTLLDDPILSDVWNSPDGVTWTQVAASSPWGAQGRSEGASGCNGVWDPIAGYFGGYMHVLGGHRSTSLSQNWNDWPATREHWRSTDGVTWERMPDMPFDRGGVMDAVVLCSTMFIVSGNSGTRTTRVLPTDTWAWNGTEWRQMSTTSNGVWTGKDYVSIAAFDDKLWILTGFDLEAGNSKGGCWSRDLGRTWEFAFAPTWNASHADACAVGNSRIAIATGNGQEDNTYQVVVT